MGNNRGKGRGNDAGARSAGNRQKILAAIIDLAGASRTVTRKTLADHTGLTITIIEDHVKNLKDDGLIHAPLPGIYEPVVQQVERPVSGTYVPGGGFKLEIGDFVLELSPRETLNVARLTGGHALLAGR
jgi:hypothetical protein